MLPWNGYRNFIEDNQHTVLIRRRHVLKRPSRHIHRVTRHMEQRTCSTAYMIFGIFLLQGQAVTGKATMVNLTRVDKFRMSRCDGEKHRKKLRYLPVPKINQNPIKQPGFTSCTPTIEDIRDIAYLFSRGLR